MPKRVPIDIQNQANVVLSLVRTEKGWRRERLLVIKAALEQQPIRTIARQFSRSHTTIQDWINRYREGGVDRLLDKRKGNGPPSRLTEEMQTALKEQLEKGQWRTAQEAWEWLSSNFDMGDLKPTVIYKYLGKCGGRLKVTRPSNPKADKEAQAKFKEELSSKMKQLNLPKDKPVRLWVYDEMRYGLHPLTRKMWCLKGVRAIAPSNRRYDFGYTYGALQVGGGGAEFLFTPNLNKQWDQKFLQQISERDPYSHHVVVGDGAGFHHRQGAKEIPDNVHVITLPAYSPELNPIEKLWDVVKDGICNRNWEDLGELEKAIEKRLEAYWSNAKKVFSLIGSSYLLSELNAI